jgi:hypothetical protein
VPKVLNKHFDEIPEGAVWIMRPGKWGNPYSHMPHTQAQYRVHSREEAVAAYEEHFEQNEQLKADLHELRGKDLICCCKPRQCHGDFLMRKANELP